MCVKPHASSFLSFFSFWVPHAAQKKKKPKKRKKNDYGKVFVATRVTHSEQEENSLATVEKPLRGKGEN